MVKHLLFVVGIAVLPAGTAFAESSPEPSVLQVSAADRKSGMQATAVAASQVGAEASRHSAAKAPEPELHPDARPVYLDGGYFGGK
jgi:hypothetical protein